MRSLLSLIRALQHTGLLSLAGIRALLEALRATGINLMTLLYIPYTLHPSRIAIVDDQGQLSYAALWQQTQQLAMALQQRYGLCSGQRIAIACRSHSAAIKAIFASSRLGCDLFLLNPEMSGKQFLELEERLHITLYIYDQHTSHIFEQPSLKNKALPSYHPDQPSVESLSLGMPRSQSNTGKMLPRRTMGRFVVLTGGTTGQPKAISRSPSALNYLPPFFALLTQMQLDRYQSMYIAAPIYHGYGISLLFMSTVLGMTIYLSERFQAAQACELIARHAIQTAVVVPLMLQRMLKQSPAALASLRAILCGSAVLSPTLAQQSLKQLGPIVFNLYGSSEAGFSIMSSPTLLARKAASIGRPLPGVGSKIIDQTGQEVQAGRPGQLYIRSRWAASKNAWVATGDLAYQDAEGDYFLVGRADDMVISGGEKVYPVELEHILEQHPAVESAAAIGIPDPEFGQRLKAIVVLKSDAHIDQATLLEWLKSRVARYQMPAVIEFHQELPYTAVGKLDRKALRQ